MIETLYSLFAALVAIVIIAWLPIILILIYMRLGRIADAAEKTADRLDGIKVYLRDNDGICVGQNIREILTELRLAAQERHEAKQNKPYRDR